MAATTFVAGAYTATWNSATIGGTRDGFHVRTSLKNQMIHMDTYGEAAVDAVQVGAEIEVSLDFVQYGSIKAALNAQLGTQGDVLTNVGKLLVDGSVVKALVLTPTAGTAAATDGGAWTFSKAIIINDIDLLLGSHLREGPVTFRCFPDISTGVVFTVA